MDKKELKKLLEKNKLANTLMNDESFKQGAEEILKSEGVDYNSEDLESVLKAIEGILSGEVQIKNDKDLDDVVGGIGAKDFARGAIKMVCSVGGSCLGYYAGKIVGDGASKKYIQFDTMDRLEYDNVSSINEIYRMHISEINYSRGIGAGLGIAGGGVAGYKLGNFLCDKLGLNENN